MVMSNGIPSNEETIGAARESLSIWMKAQFDRMESEYTARIEILRTAGEHPSPIFSGFVKRFAALGISKKQIAQLLNISTGVLKNNYDNDYDLGIAEANILVASNMLRIATSDTDANNAKVGMHWLDRRGGEPWKPPAQKMVIDDERQSPPVIDSSKLTFEERQTLREMLLRIDAGGEGEPLRSEEEDPVIP